MIAKSYISENLARIDVLYRRATTAKASLFYSKLAILELGGWIEISWDEIVMREARKRLRTTQSITFVTDVVDKCYGFTYAKHFRKMLVNVIGLDGVERLERRVDGVKFAAMTGALNALKQFRDREAHEYMKGVTRVLDAPSVTRGRFAVIYDGIMEIDRVLRALR